MAFKLEATASDRVYGKKYFWHAMHLGQGVNVWCYASADAATAVDGSGYIDDDDAISALNVGDLVLHWQADSITDSNNIQADFAAGLADFSIHMVMENTGTVVDLSNDLLGGTLTYGD